MSVWEELQTFLVLSSCKTLLSVRLAFLRCLPVRHHLNRGFLSFRGFDVLAVYPLYPFTLFPDILPMVSPLGVGLLEGAASYA